MLPKVRCVCVEAKGEVLNRIHMLKLMAVICGAVHLDWCTHYVCPS